MKTTPQVPATDRFVVTSASPSQLIAEFGSGWRAVVLDGRQMVFKADALQSFARSLEFPAHFGSNWDALNDCLSELAWEDENKVLLIISSADSVLSESLEERTSLLKVLWHAFDDAGDDEGAELRVAFCSVSPSLSPLLVAASAADVPLKVR